MTAWYLSLEPEQEPFELGVDAAGRQQYAFNVLARKTFSETFDEELRSLLEDADVATYGVNLFLSATSMPPNGDGPYVSVIETAGLAALRTHNQISPPAYSQPGAQILVRGTDARLARVMAWAAWHALQGIRNMEIEVTS